MWIYVKKAELVAGFKGPGKDGSLRGYHRIGAYLGVCHATARRWAKLGMPVHISPDLRVTGYTYEIDEWLKLMDITLHCIAV